MKRFILVALHEGPTFEIPLERLIPDVPAYVLSNDPKVLRAVSELSQEGFCPKPDDPRPRWIAGSCIKFIDIVFEEHQHGMRVRLTRTLDDLKEGSTGLIWNQGDRVGVVFDGNDSVSVNRRVDGKTYKVVDYCTPVIE